MRSRFRFSAVRLTISCTVLVLGSGQVHQARAQAVLTASKTMDLSAFAGYSNTAPDYYSSPRNSGVTIGVNITRYFHFPVAPSFEARVNVADGSILNERSYLIGLRGQVQALRVLPRVHAYADFLAGPGNIHFNFNTNGYLGDNSPVYSYGGGADIDLARNFQAKVDYQRQHWNTGEITFTPGALTFGINYRFPFHPHFRQSDIPR